MHFTNTIFSSNSNQELDKPNNVIFGNIILESTRQAELDDKVKLLLDRAKEALKAKDSQKVKEISEKRRNRLLLDIIVKGQN